jgi:hypothetical protein
VTRQVSHCVKAKEVQHRGKPNIILPLLHNVKGDSQNQSVTTFTSCKSMTRQLPCFANKKENVISTLLHNVKEEDSQSQSVTTFTSCKSATR